MYPNLNRKSFLENFHELQGFYNHCPILRIRFLQTDQPNNPNLKFIFGKEWELLWMRNQKIFGTVSVGKITNDVDNETQAKELILEMR